jgi:hypothetical protein
MFDVGCGMFDVGHVNTRIHKGLRDALKLKSITINAFCFSLHIQTATIHKSLQLFIITSLSQLPEY